VIKTDWLLIHSQVAANRATDLSEGHTRYLGACTKGAGHGQVRKQADATSAKPRAFSLKRSYVQFIYDKYVIKQVASVPVVKVLKARPKLFEDVIQDAFKRFYGLTASEIAGKLRVEASPNAKNFNALITKKLFKIPPESEIEEFRKAGIVTRTIRVKRNGLPKEHISFPYFEPLELAKEGWDDSTLKTQFSSRFFFVVYVEDKKGLYRLKATFFWAVPNFDLEGPIRKVWEETRNRLKSKVKVAMPGQKENRITHVRPHGRNAQDRVVSPHGWFLTKPCFWLDGRYLSEQLKLKDLTSK
jgi:DNA mismatch repair protein MutH